MAEAHAAVAFSFVVTQEGLDFNVNREALKAVWKSGCRSWRKSIARFRNKFLSNIFPFRPSSWLVVIVFLFAVSLAGLDISYYGVSSIEYIFSQWFGVERHLHLMSCFVFSFLLWLSGVLFVRYTLWMLFSYNRWMYEPHGRLSLTTKLWFMLVKILCGRSTPRLYSYQGSLPKLPVPCLEDTLKKYLRSVRPLMSDQEWTETTLKAQEFKRNHGMKLQFYLTLKYWFSSNYVSDWWEDYVYLHGRSPIMVNSNFYGIDCLGKLNNGTQASRAAHITYFMLEHSKSIAQEKLRPMLINDMVPMCSMQYERQFNTVRIPQEDKDIVMHWRDSYHIAVYHKGRFYKMYFYFDHKRLQPCELEEQFQWILDDKSQPQDGEEHLAALTAGERIPWARARANFFADGVNYNSLSIIEKAAFVVVLDEEEYCYDINNTDRVDSFAKAILHGKGYDRWFDKSLNLIVSKNGKAGFNCEHSWADAPIAAHMWEYVLSRDYIASTSPTSTIGYTESGKCVGTPRARTPKPLRLQWEIPPECMMVIETSRETAENLIRDVDLYILCHTQFGKGDIKKCKFSPDAFIQMALQLAYYRDMGKSCLTYEAASTRAFKEGRTETVRSCSIESAAFVKIMEDPNSSQEDKQSAIKKAIERHVLTTRDALTGKGVDRHLFCLYVVSKYIGIESPFLQKILSEPWRLSTSQTPVQQARICDMTKNPEYVSVGGGFGPVSDDGYGVSYIIAGEDLIFFHITCKNSCQQTDSKRFGNRIQQAMADMRNLFR